MSSPRRTIRASTLFGGPVETFAAGIKEGIFEPYKSPSFAKLPARFKQVDGQWTAIADDPLVFMTNAAFLKTNNPKPPASWGDLRTRPTRTACRWRRAPRHGGDAHLLGAGGLRPQRGQGLRLPEEARPNVQVYTKSGGGGTLPVGLGQAAGGIFFIVDALETKAKGHDVVISFPRRASAARPRRSR